MDKEKIEAFKKQSRIYRELAYLLDKAVIAIENGEDDKVEEIKDVLAIKILELTAMKVD
ncbi:hypothetical protein [Clostridium thermobutyricum]|uniref:hypothetical protein n=1 Tax=Clostridium thermobutyricum TaxID=29372 RepID=UPI0018AB5497|nr:hypothetical protein [Clostridium thermobutyricum]